MKESVAANMGFVFSKVIADKQFRRAGSLLGVDLASGVNSDQQIGNKGGSYANMIAVRCFEQKGSTIVLHHEVASVSAAAHGQSFLDSVAIGCSDFSSTARMLRLETICMYMSNHSVIAAVEMMQVKLFFVKNLRFSVWQQMGNCIARFENLSARRIFRATRHFVSTDSNWQNESGSVLFF